MKVKSSPIANVDLTGKIVVLKEKELKPEHRTLRNRVYRATGGFGCSPTAIGTAVFTEALTAPFEKERWERFQIEGWLTDEEYATLTMDLLSK